MLAAAVILIELKARRLNQAQDQASDAYRSAVLLVEFLQSELDGAYVVPGLDGDSRLAYRPAQANGNRLGLGISGSALQQAEVILGLDGQGEVIRTQASQKKTVSRLGRAGKLQFYFPSDNRLLVKIHSEPFPNKSYDTAYEFLLCNQK